MKTKKLWEEVFRRFGKEKSAMNATDFYAGDRFTLHRSQEYERQ